MPALYNPRLIPLDTDFYSSTLLPCKGSDTRKLQSYGYYGYYPNNGIYDSLSFFSPSIFLLNPGLKNIFPSPTTDAGFFSPVPGTGAAFISPIYNYYPMPPNSPIIPSSSSNCVPASAPTQFAGKWQSRQLTDENGNPLKGDMRIDKVSDQKIVKMTGSSLPLGEGSLNQFQYTPTQGMAPISFKALFYRSHSAQFTGTADNRLCCKNFMCFWAGTFEVEGGYVFKDNSGQIVDEGSFNLKGPVGSPTPTPEPDEAIEKRRTPVAEARKILSLTKGLNGIMYGGTQINCLDEGHMFSYDPDTGNTVDLGNPGYECNAVTTGTDNLIYIGGGARNPLPDEGPVVGYANFAVYDLDESWNPGQDPEANPRDLGQAVSCRDCGLADRIA